MKRNIYILFAALLAMSMLGTACSSSKKAVEQSYTQEKSEAPAPEETPFALMAEAYTPWTDISIPVKMSLAAPKKLSVSGTLKMVKGECISISAKLLLFEIGTVYIDNDSVFVISKMDNSYLAESMARVKEELGLCLDDIQSILMSRVFAPGKGTVKASDSGLFKISTAKNELTLTPRTLPAGLEWDFKVKTDNEQAILKSLDIRPASLPELTCSFGAPEKSMTGPLPSSVQFNATFGKSNFNGTLTYTPTRASVNSGLKVSRPTISRNARKISIDTLVKLLKAL